MCAHPPYGCAGDVADVTAVMVPLDFIMTIFALLDAEIYTSVTTRVHIPSKSQLPQPAAAAYATQTVWHHALLYLDHNATNSPTQYSYSIYSIQVKVVSYVAAEGV